MEILQTIWNVLTSENERLISVILSPLFFVENYLYMLNFMAILKIESTKKQQLLYVLLTSTIAILNMFFIPMPYNTYINVFIGPILVFIIFKISILKSILSEVIIYIISLVLGTPLIIVYTHVFKISSSLVSVVPLYRISYCISFFTLMTISCWIFKKKSLNLSILSDFKRINYKLLIINSIIGLIAIAFQLYIEFSFIDYIPFYLVVLGIIILLVYFIISLISLIRTSKLESTTEELEKEHLYNQTLGLLYDNIRGFKHDFNNIVQGIGGYISTNNMDGLKEYYSQILDDCQRVNNLALLSPEVINNPAIYSLLAAKYHDANELGIKVNIEVFMDLSNINMKIYELTRILGILLDNAIEASKQCEEKEINIIMRKDLRTDKQLFIIENTYLNKDVNIDEIFEKGKTSKTTKDSNNHGLGLWEVRNLVRKRKNLNLYTTKDEKHFKQQFEIYCTKI